MVHRARLEFFDESEPVVSRRSIDRLVGLLRDLPAEYVMRLSVLIGLECVLGRRTWASQ